VVRLGLLQSRSATNLQIMILSCRMHAVHKAFVLLFRFVIPPLPGSLLGVLGPGLLGPRWGYLILELKMRTQSQIPSHTPELLCEEI